MRFRLIYLFSFILSAVVMWFFRTNATIVSIYGMLSNAFVVMGLVLAFAFVWFTSIGAAASLRRSKKYARTIFKSLFWAIFATVVAVAIAYVINLLLVKPTDIPESFLEESYLINSVDMFRNPNARSWMELLHSISFNQYGYFTIFGVVIFCLFLGYLLKPDTRIIEPAYTLSASLCEVGFRLYYVVSNICIVTLFVIAGAFFARILGSDKDELISDFITIFKSNTKLMINLGILTAALIFVVFPILFLFFSKFRSNPFSAMYTSIVTGLVTIFTGNILFTLPISQTIQRTQMNSMKKTTVTSGNILFLLCRAGSASVAYLAIMTLLKSTMSGVSVSFTMSILIALLCMGFSMVSGCFAGIETFAIISLVSLVYPAYFSEDILTLAIGYSPFISLVGIFIDTFALNYGMKACDIPLKKVKASKKEKKEDKKDKKDKKKEVEDKPELKPIAGSWQSIASSC